MRKKSVLIVGILALVIFAAGWLFAAGMQYTVELTIGSVSVSTDGGKTWSDAYPEMQLSQKDLIRTGKDSSCEIILPNRGILKVESDSKVSLEKMSASEEKVKVSQGKVLFNITKKTPTQTFKVETDVAVVAIRGTQFVVETDGEEITTGVVEGKVSVKRQVTIPASLTSPELEAMLEVDVEDKQEIVMTMDENEKLQDLINQTRKNLPELKKILRSNQTETQKKIRMMKNAQKVVDDMRTLDSDQSESAEELDNILDKYKQKQGYK